jgi:hypothetical protein
MEEVEMTTSRRLDRQEMERRVVLLEELHEDVVRRHEQFGQDILIGRHLSAARTSAYVALRIAREQLEAYREEWERVK